MPKGIGDDRDLVECVGDFSWWFLLKGIGDDSNRDLYRLRTPDSVENG